MKVRRFSGDKTHKNNNSIGYAFLSVQIPSIILYLFESQASSFFGTTLGTTPHADTKNTLAVATIVVLISFTWFLLRNHKTPNPREYFIRFPLLPHYILLVLETSYFIFLGGLHGDVVGRREMFGAGEANIGILKISTVFLYVSTSLLFARLGMSIISKDSRYRKRRTLLIVTAILTWLIFLMKDLQTGSRGSFLNFIALALAGYTFVKPVNIRKLRWWIVRYGWVVLLLVSWAFYKLTDFRAGGIASSIIYDTILTKFSANLAVVHDYIIKDLPVRSYVQGIKMTEWASVSSLGWSSLARDDVTDISNWDFFPTLKSVVRKYLLRDSSYTPNSLHYSMYGDYPFNSASFLLQIVVLGWIGVVGFFGALFAIRAANIRKLPLRFGVYVYMFYFSIVSFTGFSLTEIPFILLPFIAVCFSRCFVYRPSALPGPRVAASTKGVRENK